MFSQLKHQFLLHFIILLWGLTGILGKLIELDAVFIVWYRCTCFLLLVIVFIVYYYSLLFVVAVVARRSYFFVVCVCLRAFIVLFIFICFYCLFLIFCLLCCVLIVFGSLFRDF